MRQTVGVQGLPQQLRQGGQVTAGEPPTRRQRGQGQRHQQQQHPAQPAALLKKCPAQNQRMRDVLVYPDKGGLRPEEEKFIELLRRQAALTVK